MRIEELIMKSERSLPMPDTYARALRAIVKIREEDKALDISKAHKPCHHYRGRTLSKAQHRARSILRTLHDLGEVLWYDGLGIALFHDSVILDPLLLIDFIRDIYTHKRTNVTLSHADLTSLPYWIGISNQETMEAMKQAIAAKVQRGTCDSSRWLHGVGRRPHRFFFLY
jgi:hypothetical protein